MEAKAIDIRIPGIPIAQLRDAALSLRRGVSVTTLNPILCMWMWPGAPLVAEIAIIRDSGSCEGIVKSPVKSVDVIVEIDFAILLDNRR